MSWIDPEQLRRSIQQVRDKEQLRRELVALRPSQKFVFCYRCSFDIVRSASATLSNWTKKKRHDADHVINIVCAYFNVERRLLEHKTRKRQIVAARQVAMYFLKDRTAMSHKAIGEIMGGRDHTTSIHSIQTVKNLLEVDDKMREDIENLRRIL